MYFFWYAENEQSEESHTWWYDKDFFAFSSCSLASQILGISN